MIITFEQKLKTKLNNSDPHNVVIFNLIYVFLLLNNFVVLYFLNPCVFVFGIDQCE